MSLVTAVTEKATDNRDYNYSFQQCFQHYANAIITIDTINISHTNFTSDTL